MRIRFSSLSVAAVVVAALIAAPVLSVFSNVLAGDTGATWSHLADTVLGEFKTRLGRIGIDYQSPKVPA